MTQVGRISFGSLHPHVLGFDDIFRHLEKTLEQSNTQSYPPHNIIKVGDNRYIVELAIAGFTQDEVDITIKENQLLITGSKGTQKEEEGVTYLHRGIGTRAFRKVIQILDTVEVRGAEYRDGVLRIGLENVIPDNKKPRKVEIGEKLSFSNPQLLTE